MEKKTGEENLECIFKMRTKLYRLRDEQWKERGIGNLKIMRDRAQRKIRVLMRQEKTLKPVANHLSKSIKKRSIVLLQIGRINHSLAMDTVAIVLYF